MTFATHFTLQEAIAEALEQTNNGGTRDVIRHLQLNFRRILDENSMTIEALGLGQMIRAQRKKPPKKDYQERLCSLCLDFGLPVLDLDDEIAVPIDMTNVLGSECDWPELEDATIDDLDKHLQLRAAQQIAHDARTRNYVRLRQAAANVVPGQTDIPLRQLREIARRQRGPQL